MAVRELIKKPHPMLNSPASEVKDVAAPEVQQLIDDMLESIAFHKGVGLAANQLNAGLRVCVISLPDHPGLGGPFVMVNPVITERKGSRRVFEGCLSVGGAWQPVTRSEQVSVEALDRHGHHLSLADCTGLLAQVIEHEVEHLDGRAQGTEES